MRPAVRDHTGQSRGEVLVEGRAAGFIDWSRADLARFGLEG